MDLDFSFLDDMDLTIDININDMEKDLIQILTTLYQDTDVNTTYWMCLYR